MSLLANCLWYVTSLPSSVRFAHATRNVPQVQKRKLLSILNANASTAFGRRYHFGDIQSMEEYQARVPLATYEEIRPWLERVERGEQAVLTREPVLLLEPTSGSSSATKYIPYTRSLKRDFQAGIAPWVMYSFSRYHGLIRGPSYWSVTPVVCSNRRTAGGIPIGFEDESDYLGGLGGRVVRSLMAVPPEVKQIADWDSFRYATLLFLLRRRDLALISVWNPTFLMLMLEPLAAWSARLVEDIACGALSPPQELPRGIHSTLLRSAGAAPRRAGEVAGILGDLRRAGAAERMGELHARLWPRLVLISCWGDASAAPYAAQLAELFPQATVQPKGLISTEAFVSFPIPGRNGSALSLNSHFFEFLPSREKERQVGSAGPTEGRCLLAHELEIGRRYSVIVTTSGGLYRYQTNDQVQVTGRLAECPLLRFTGREGLVSDWFGEKLNEQHVGRVLSSLFAEHGLQPEFAMLACDDSRSPACYTLYIQDVRSTDADLAAIGIPLDLALQENYHYSYCRRVGQLGQTCVFRVERNAAGDSLRSGMARGQRAGDIKPSVLDRHGGWSSVFTGRTVSA